MSTSRNEQRPTPETDAAVYTATFGTVEHTAVHPDFARKLERERDEAREKIKTMHNRLVAFGAEMEAMRSERDQLSRDLSSLLAGDCLDGHDAVEGARNGIAMREAIKEAHSTLRQIHNHGQGAEVFPAQPDDHPDCSWCVNFRNTKNALAKLQPFLQP